MKMCRNLLFAFILFLMFALINPGQIAAKNNFNQLPGRAFEVLEEKIEEEIENEEEEPEEEVEEENEEEDESIETEDNENKEEHVNKKENKPTLETFSQYDFVPGDKILYYEDFSGASIGDFPANWSTNGGGEVKTVNIAPGKWFHMNVADAVYCYSKTIPFPDNFILEFDIIPNAEYDEFEFTIYENTENVGLDENLYPGSQGIHINPNTEYSSGWHVKGYYEDQWLEGNSERNPVVREQVNHVIVWVQKRRVRIYHSGAKALDMPTALPPDIKLNRLRFACWYDETKPLISNIKITTASPDIRSKLITEGKLVSYGIYFDSGKDIVKPESYGSISQIAKTLSDNPGVRIKIVGHTDSDGNDADNLSLSRQRAESVKNYLVKHFNVEPGRIETDGKGEAEPIEKNDNAENKAKNRRVEFIKL